MANKISLTGNDTAAYAFKQAHPDVAAVFPITPQTEAMHKFSSYVANGEVETKLIPVESEHSAMSAAVGASSGGARAITATSANGLALMWEIVYITASLRLPVVMALVNRALSGPINIHCDHSDAMGARDSGWIQLFAEDAQEVYDNLLQAFRIGENSEVLLPVMVCYDGFVISHTQEVLEVLDDKVVNNFVGEYDNPNSLLTSDKPLTVGPLDLQDWYFEHKRQQIEGMEKSRKVILDVAQKYASLSGREYGYFEPYKLEDAEIAIVSMGSTGGTVKETVDALREKGHKAGAMKIRTYRPFPYQEVKEVLGDKKKVMVLDRAPSFGAQGSPLYLDVVSACSQQPSMPKIVNFLYGLGGRDINMKQIEEAYMKVNDDSEKPFDYIGLRD